MSEAFRHRVRPECDLGRARVRLAKGGGEFVRPCSTAADHEAILHRKLTNLIFVAFSPFAGSVKTNPPDWPNLAI
jgi:hypothetical protein